MAVACAGLLVPALPASAAIFANFDASRQERFLPGTFTPNPNFFLRDKYDISGIAVDPAVGTFGAHGGVLISPQHVLTAWHFGPGGFTFEGNDGALHSYSVAAGGYTRLSTTFDDGSGNLITRPSDVAIARLATPVNPAHGINPVPIIGSDPARFAGHHAYAFGQNNQAGSNIIEEAVLVVIPDANGNPVQATHTVRWDFDTAVNGGTNGPVNGEMGVIGGDSGNPILGVANGELALFGAHWVIDSNTPGPNVNYSTYSSFLGAYLDPIQSLVQGDGHDVRIVEVPEPGAAGLAVAAAGLGLLRRRRTA